MINMPQTIIQLNPDVIGKIAAGEVVERPAAAIKELVENSIDANATAITIEIKKGGISYFRITDNGDGIQPNDIKLAFSRHATSKIRTADDLHHLETLGFRGEALASIAAVSRVQLTTRTVDQSNGTRVEIEGGIYQKISEAACTEGTTLVVKDLFFNTPVRLKFLKKPITEASFVSDLIMRLILSHPEISFRFINDGKTVYTSIGDGQLESAVFSIYGRKILASLRKISGTMHGLIVNGYIGVGDCERGNRNQESFFINGRYLKNTLLSQAVERACRERIMIGKYPVCIMHIQMPYDLVDVNVHPNKLEVRFQNEKLVEEAIECIIQETLSQDTLLTNIPTFSNSDHVQVRSNIYQTDKIQTSVQKESPTYSDYPLKPMIPMLPVDNTGRLPVGTTELNEGLSIVSSLRKNNNTDEPITVKPTNQRKATIDSNVTQNIVEEQTSLIEEDAYQLTIIGLYLNTYILVQYENQLLMIDQHAAHERLLFDKMMTAYDQQSMSQTLLIPQSLTLSLKEMDTYLEYRSAINQAGFETDIFGERNIQIRAVPIILGTPQLDIFFPQMLDTLESKRNISTFEKRREAILQQACKHAVKGGEQLSMLAIEDIILRMVKQGVTPTCPHGRPLVISFSKSDVERRFKRIK